MRGAGPFSKAKWLLLVTSFLLWLIPRGSYFTNSLYLNVDLLRLYVGEDACCVDRFQGHGESQQNRLIWLQGYNQWVAGDREQAISTWQKAPTYAAAMLITCVQNNRLTEVSVREMALSQALQLDPNTLKISETASFLLLRERSWEVTYAAFRIVTEEAPENAVAKAALALAGWHVGESAKEVLRLIDAAMAEAPENIYVLRYGLRLMQSGLTFGAERTAQLANLIEAHLPQDFELTFGVASASRSLGEYEKAFHYNLSALSISPNHPWANLHQVELLQIQDKTDVEPWLDKAFSGRVASRPDYYRRLISVLIEADEIDKAYQVYCDGLSQEMMDYELVRLLDQDDIEVFHNYSCAVVDK